MKVSGRLISILAVNILLFLIAGLFVEGVFRLAGIPYKVKYVPNENSFARFDPELGWSYIPGVSTMHKTGDTEIPVHFDVNGLRVRDAHIHLDGSKPSVLFIGGSFTMGHGLRYEESFVGRFAAFKDVTYQIVNAGVQGYGSDQALLALQRYVPKFNAKVVVYTFIEDHILRNGNYDRRMLVPTARFLGTKPKFGLRSDKTLYLEKRPVLYENYLNSYLFDFLQMRIGSIFRMFPPFPEETTKAIIYKMKEYSSSHGARFILLNWRWTDQDYDNIFHDMDIDIIDTMEEAPDGWENMVLFGGVHPDAEASDHAARLLLKYFHDRDLLNIQ